MERTVERDCLSTNSAVSESELLSQTFLRETPVGEFFFSVVAKEQTVKNILKQAYYDASTVTDELVQVKALCAHASNV